jgi:hypothetical protein
MPAKSPAQKRFMQAVAHSPKFADKVGVPQKVGREFSKFSEGAGPSGIMRIAEAEAAAEAGMSVEEYRAARKRTAAAQTPASGVGFFTEPDRDREKKRREGPPEAMLKKKFSRGGKIDGCALRGKTR